MFELDDPTLRSPRQFQKDVPQDTFERDLALREMQHFNKHLPPVPAEKLMPSELSIGAEDI